MTLTAMYLSNLMKSNWIRYNNITTEYFPNNTQSWLLELSYAIKERSMPYKICSMFYKKRLGRIVVDVPKEVAMRISRMENIETQTAMKTQPYVEILKHAHRQWLAYSKPMKPKAGVPIVHESIKLWDVSFQLLLLLIQLFSSSVSICDKMSRI